MLLPLHVTINTVDEHTMGLAWGFYLISFFSMHYHIGVAFGFWGAVDCIPRKLDISAQILMFPNFAYATSNGSAIFTLTCFIAMMVPLCLAWLPGVSTDGMRWQVNFVLGFFASSGLLLRGEVLYFIGAVISGFFAGFFYISQYQYPSTLCLSRLGLSGWLFFVCMACRKH